MGDADGNSVTRLGFHATTEKRVALLATGIVFTLASWLVMVLRLLVLRLRRRSQGLDDVAMYFAFACSIGFAAASFLSFQRGAGLRISNVRPAAEQSAIEAMYFVQLFYLPAIFFIKASLLFLYLRIAYSSATNFYRATIATLVVLVAQFISSMIITGLQCVPISKYWDRSVNGHCIDIAASFFWRNIFTVVSDVVIIGLPIPTLWKIQRPRAQRIGLIAAFVMGSGSTIASIIRLYSVYVYTASNETMEGAAPIIIWSFIEVSLGMLCASVPAVKPLFVREKQSHSSSADPCPNGTDVDSYPLRKESKASGGRILDTCSIARAVATADWLSQSDDGFDDHVIPLNLTPKASQDPVQDPAESERYSHTHFVPPSFTYDADARRSEGTASLQTFESDRIMVSKSISVTTDKHKH